MAASGEEVTGTPVTSAAGQPNLYEGKFPGSPDLERSGSTYGTWKEERQLPYAPPFPTSPYQREGPAHFDLSRDQGIRETTFDQVQSEELYWQMRKDFIDQTGVSEDDLKKMDLKIKGKGKSKSKQEKKEYLNQEYNRKLATLEEESDKEIQLGKAIGRKCEDCGRTSRFGTVHCCEVCRSTCGKKHGKECDEEYLEDTDSSSSDSSQEEGFKLKKKKKRVGAVEGDQPFGKKTYAAGAPKKLLVDLKGQKMKPPNAFDGDLKQLENWTIFRHKLFAYLNMIDGDFSELMRQAEKFEGQIKSLNSQKARELSAYLYNLLVTLTTGPAATRLYSYRIEEGFECWRRLALDHNPVIPGRGRILLTRIMQTDLSPAMFEKNFPLWEGLHREYEQITGEVLSDHLLIGTVVSQATGALGDHLRLHADEFKTYRQVSRIIKSWYLLKRGQELEKSPGIATPTSLISAIGSKGYWGKGNPTWSTGWSYGGSTSKGKGKGKKGWSTSKGKGQKGKGGSTSKGK